MPNWCNNTIEVLGQEEELKFFMEEVSSCKSKFDFRKIIPYDEEQRENCKKEWLLKKETKEIKERSIDDDFEQYWYKKLGYTWCIVNWGTKWFVNEVCVNKYNGCVEFFFATAWNPPYEIYKTIIERFPKLTFEISYDEPSMLFGGDIHGEGGKISSEEYDLENAFCPDCKSDGEATKREYEEKFICPNCGKEFTEKESWKEDD